MARAHQQKAHRTRRKTRSYDTARGSQRKISRTDGFQAKASEECSSAVRNPELGQWWVQQRINFPRKAAVKAEHSSQLLHDVKGSVDSGMDTGGEGWQRQGAGERE